MYGKIAYRTLKQAITIINKEFSYLNKPIGSFSILMYSKITL